MNKIPSAALEAAEKAASDHSTEEIPDKFFRTFTARCKTCGEIPDEPGVRFKHPTKMALEAAVPHMLGGFEISWKWLKA